MSVHQHKYLQKINFKNSLCYPSTSTLTSTSTSIHSFIEFFFQRTRIIRGILLQCTYYRANDHQSQTKRKRTNTHKKINKKKIIPTKIKLDWIKIAKQEQEGFIFCLTCDNKVVLTKRTYFIHLSYLTHREREKGLQDIKQESRHYYNI